MLVEGLWSISRKTSCSTRTVLAERGMSISYLLTLKDQLSQKLSMRSFERFPIRYSLFENHSLYKLCAALPFPFAVSYVRWISASSAFVKHYMLYEITAANASFPQWRLVSTDYTATSTIFTRPFSKRMVLRNILCVPSNLYVLSNPFKF